MGDDLALLALAKEAPAADIKLAAVLALTGEEALREAEREFRTHDRRVHRAAKELYKTAVERRETRVQADELIQAAAALMDEPLIPANRLVELDHAWSALNASLIEDAQATRFSELQQGLATLLRERTEARRAVNVWSADAKQALAHLDAMRGGIENHDITPHDLLATLAAASTQARTTLAALPATANIRESDLSALAALEQALRTALQDSAPIEARLIFLDALARDTLPPETAAEDVDSAVQGAFAETPHQRWQALATIAEQRTENALNARFEACQRIRQDAQRKRQIDKHKRVEASGKATHQAQVQALAKAAGSVEEALAAGHLADALKHMAGLNAAMENGDVAPSMKAGIERLQTEVARLKGWQHWGGQQARDELVGEAEVLARSIVAEGGASPGKLPVKQIEKYIEQLRARWKQLDKAGGANSKAMWERFNDALKTAHVPIAEHHARLNEVRLENLAARESLLTTLEALNIAGDDSGTAPDWKEIARVLAHFQTEWRQLGPLLHTVPHKQQAALAERMKSSIARVEAPLREVRHRAKVEREQFIVRARALSENAQDRDVIAKVRELQAQWQQHAKLLPLPRAVENALWADFKAATGVVMDRREEAHHARNAQLEANQAAREELIVRLRAVEPEAPAAEIKRLIAEIDAEWRKAGEAPRNQAVKLGSRYRDARDNVQHYLANSAQRKWHDTCDALASKLALCHEFEAQAPADVADIEARWAALPALPPRWEQALQARFNTCGENASAAASGETLDDQLLQLEATLDIPSPPAFQAARRMLKLQWMKEALEGRRSVSPDAAAINEMTAGVFGCRHYNAEQCQRLDAIIAVLRQSAPGALGR